MLAEWSLSVVAFREQAAATVTEAEAEVFAEVLLDDKNRPEKTVRLMRVTDRYKWPRRRIFSMPSLLGFRLGFLVRLRFYI